MNENTLMDTAGCYPDNLGVKAIDDRSQAGGEAAQATGLVERGALHCSAGV
jgi:hypothetical protein